MKTTKTPDHTPTGRTRPKRKMGTVLPVSYTHLTKDLTASVLSQGLRTIATQGNLNNQMCIRDSSSSVQTSSHFSRMAA